jgi:tetraacyldisaccharide 4'-kinase
MLVVAETEIWPNLFREVKRAGCGLIVVNGRISDRAAPRYRRRRWFFSHALIWPDAILAQNTAIAGRFIAAGAPPAKVTAAGNLKYDFQPGCPPTEVVAFLDQLAPAAIWIAASTMPPDEDDTVIAAFHELAAENSGLLLILVPRKPERFELAATQLAEAGVSFVRRSALAPLNLPGVLLLDSMGELSGLFSRADVVFMGGTLAPRGGHNILEPAMFGKPIVVGPHMENFREIADTFHDAGAMVEIAASAELKGAVADLLRDQVRAGDIGRRAKACSEAQSGATSIAVARIRELYEKAAPRIEPVPPLRLLLWIYHQAGALKRRYQLKRVVKLRAPVISVGNLTMGGSGKTPMTLYLAERLSKPAILTRGYRRQSSGNLILGAGEQADWRDTGDEAQIFLRSRAAPVGIGADRAQVGRLVEDRFAVEHFILDDGFQHWKLVRQVDIVLIDALDPFPISRLREPLASLSRADIFVITRSRASSPQIERELRRYNAGAPIFYATVKPECWIEGATGQRLEVRDPRFTSAAAFCGLANPASFWTTLADIGVKPSARIAFPDHTRYSAATIADLRNRHGVLLTTEKDWINLGASPPAGIYWLKIRIEVYNEDAFLRAIDWKLMEPHRSERRDRLRTPSEANESESYPA